MTLDRATRVAQVLDLVSKMVENSIQQLAEVRQQLKESAARIDALKDLHRDWQGLTPSECPQNTFINTTQLTKPSFKTQSKFQSAAAGKGSIEVLLERVDTTLTSHDAALEQLVLPDPIKPRRESRLITDVRSSDTKAVSLHHPLLKPLEFAQHRVFLMGFSWVSVTCIRIFPFKKGSLSHPSLQVAEVGLAACPCRATPEAPHGAAGGPVRGTLGDQNNKQTGCLLVCAYVLSHVFSGSLAPFCEAQEKLQFSRLAKARQHVASLVSSSFFEFFSGFVILLQLGICFEIRFCIVPQWAVGGI